MTGTEVTTPTELSGHCLCGNVSYSADTEAIAAALEWLGISELTDATDPTG